MQVPQKTHPGRSMYKNYSELSVSSVMHVDYIALQEDMLVCDALDYVRSSVTKPRILYFYTVDQDSRLKGVISTRVLLTANLALRLYDIADTRVRSIPFNAQILDVLSDFVIHKYLAMPVVDNQKRLIGIIDASSLTENVSDIIERDRVDELFETLGFHLTQIKGASPFKAFRYRFPWLIASIAGGLLSAMMTSRFENVLATALVLSFFLTLILGLGESISMQSMTVTIQSLRTRPPTANWFFREFFREVVTALLIGVASGLLVGSVVMLWQNDLYAALVIGGSLILTMLSANLIGLIIPTVLHSLHLDPKIASGPLTLTISDLFTISIYFGLAGMVLL